MSTPTQRLFSAILKDDRAAVRSILAENAGFAARAKESEARFDAEIVHWIYAGDTPLHAAAAGYRVEIIRTLLAAGADPNAAGNHRRSRPLHYAADGFLESPHWSEERQAATLRLLLDSGADLHAQDMNGATALHRAVRTRCAGAVALLLEAGADPTLQNKSGSTPFHLAVQNTGRGGSGAQQAKEAQYRILRTFLDRGVRPDLEDRAGKTVLQWAKNPAIHRLLQEGPN